VIRSLAGMDSVVSRTRPAWLWIGQLAVAWLGAHLAADRLDDALATALAGSGIPWPEPEQPLTVATWTAVALELYVAAWAAVALLRANATPVDHPRRWLPRATPHAVVAPIFFGAASLAGSWVLGMAAEDLVAGWWTGGASAIGWVVAGLVAARLGAPAVARVALCAPVPSHRWDGAVTALPALAVAILAVRYGLPIWGWLP
jgi:hypothetical protein